MSMILDQHLNSLSRNKIESLGRDEALAVGRRLDNGYGVGTHHLPLCTLFSSSIGSYWGEMGE